MPGILRGDKRQVLLETNIGKSCWDEWRDWLEAETDELPETESLADDWESLPRWPMPSSPGCCAKGHKMLLAGPSKAGKSFALIELCIAIAEGRPWLGRFSCAQGKVLYINLELDRASCLHRFKDVYTALGLPRRTCETSTSGTCAARPCPWTSWPQSSSAGPREKATPP